MRQVLGKRNVIPKRRFNRDIITTFTVTSETLHHKGGVFKMKTLKNYFPRLDTKQVALLGLLAALLLILSRFTFGPDWLKFGFSFIASGLIAKWYGPIWGAFVAFISDFLGATILTSGQPYFPGFALSAIVGALIYGFSFYNRDHLSWTRVIVTTAIVLVVVNLCLNTIWVITLQNAWHNSGMLKTMVSTRALKQLVFWPIQSILLYVILNNKQLDRLRADIFAR